SLFKAFPTMRKLSKATPDIIIEYIKGVRGFIKKANWISEIASLLKEDKNIPMTMSELTSLPGIGRKSANVIMREGGKKAEGVVVDLHVVRVANRLGIASDVKPDKLEKQIMEAIETKQWGEIGMALLFLGRDTCRPTDPTHSECIMKNNCSFYKSLTNKNTKNRIQ
ncbi:MAG: endonuclease III, partial [Bacteroidota bacterium]